MSRFGSPAILAALVACVVYSTTLWGTLIYDDLYVASADPRLAGPHEWGKYFTQTYNGGVDNLYRPVVSLTYAIQHWLHGETAWPYHLVNVALHALMSAMVAMFGSTVARRGGANEKTSQRVGLIAGLLFAVHPVHVEAVAGIVGRAELLCAIGSVGLLWLCIADRPLTRGRVVVGWLLFVLALLSKEQAMLLPVVMAAVLVVLRRPTDLPTAIAVEPTESPQPIDYRQPSTRSTRDPLLPMLFALVAMTLAGYVVLREQVLKLKLWWERGFLDHWIQPLAHVHGLDRALGPLLVAGRYLILLFVPYRLHVDYGGSITPATVHPGEPLLWLGIAAVLLWIGWFAIAWRRGDRASMAMLLAFGIVYGSVGNLVTIIGVNVAERLMYLPSVFFTILVGLFAARWIERRPRATWAIFVLVLSLATLRTVSYSIRWNDRATFYPYLVRQDPRSMKATLLCVADLLKRGRPQEAIVYGRHAVEIAPNDEDPYLWLGKALIAAGDLDEAERVLARGAAILPGGSAHQELTQLQQRRAATQVAH